MFSLAEHAGHSIELKRNDDKLDVYCYTCQDIRRSARIGSFLLEEKEKVK